MFFLIFDTYVPLVTRTEKKKKHHDHVKLELFFLVFAARIQLLPSSNNPNKVQGGDNHLAVNPRNSMMCLVICLVICLAPDIQV